MRQWSQPKKDGIQLGVDLLDIGWSYPRFVEGVAHRLEPREPLVIPLGVSGHETCLRRVAA